MTDQRQKEPVARWMRFLARVISGLWAGFWIFFAVAVVAGEIDRGEDLAFRDFLAPAAWVLTLFVFALLAWRAERAGRIVLPIAGLAVLIAYPFVGGHFPVSTRLFVMATLGIPPLATGALLIDARCRSFHGRSTFRSGAQARRDRIRLRCWT